MRGEEEGGAGVAGGDQEEGETVIDLPRDVISSPANDKYINTIIRSQTAAAGREIRQWSSYSSLFLF